MSNSKSIRKADKLPGKSSGSRTKHSRKAARAEGGGQALLFFKSFLKYPSMVGWLLPSSRFVVDDVLRNIDWSSTGVIVEYGPGLGTFTSRILERLRPDAQLIIFEINPEFIRYLKKTFRDPRLIILERSAEHVDTALADLGHSHADCVISGIPFKPIPHELRESIVRKTHRVLRPGGKFLVYQFSKTVLPYLRNSFDNVSCDRELKNVLPTRLFYCERD